MYLEEFQKWADEIDTFCLPENEHEEKIIQVVDLRHFIECYKPSLTIIDCLNHKINIVSDLGVRKGIVFFDYKEITKAATHSFLYESAALEDFKKESDIEELWFVFVKEQNDVNDEEIFGFTAAKQLTDFYHKIFIFHFFPSIIHELN